MNFWDTEKGFNIFDRLFSLLEDLFAKDRVIVGEKKGKVVQWLTTNEEVVAVIRYDDKTCGTAHTNEITYL